MAVEFPPSRLKPFGEARKNPKKPGDSCECGGAVAYNFDKDEGIFATRVTKCVECGDFWKYDIPIAAARDLR